MTFYDDYKGARKRLALTSIANQTSVIGTRVEADRRTFMTNVTVKDWNVHFRVGDTTTGTSAADNAWNVAVSKSLGGTGALAPMGSAQCGTAGQANGSVLDGTLTETNFVAGDDIVLSYEVGTSLPAGVLRVDADVDYVERYT